MSPSDRERWQTLVAALRDTCAALAVAPGGRLRVVVAAGGPAAGVRLLAGARGAWVDLVVRLGPIGAIDEVALMSALEHAPVGGVCLLAGQLCLRQTAPLADLSAAAVRDLLEQLLATACHAAPAAPPPIPHETRAALFASYAS